MAHLQAFHQQAAVIRNPRSGLVLDASDYEVKLRNYTGFESQLWCIEPSEHGRFFLRNRGNGKVLDVQGGIKNGARLITYGKHGGENQQWYINSDDTIVSSDGNLAVDICEGKYFDGNHIIAYHKHGSENQKFNFQFR